MPSEPFVCALELGRETPGRPCSCRECRVYRARQIQPSGSIIGALRGERLAVPCHALSEEMLDHDCAERFVIMLT